MSAKEWRLLGLVFLLEVAAVGATWFVIETPLERDPWYELLEPPDRDEMCGPKLDLKSCVDKRWPVMAGRLRRHLMGHAVARTLCDLGGAAPESLRRGPYGVACDTAYRDQSEVDVCASPRVYVLVALFELHNGAARFGEEPRSFDWLSDADIDQIRYDLEKEMIMRDCYLGRALNESPFPTAQQLERIRGLRAPVPKDWSDPIWDPPRTTVE